MLKLELKDNIVIPRNKMWFLRIYMKFKFVYNFHNLILDCGISISQLFPY